MKQRWAPAFTIVELLIVVAVIGILAAIGVVAYNGVNRSAAEKAAQSDLKHVVIDMENTRIRSGDYSTSLSTDFRESPNVQITVVSAGKEPFYNGASSVQNGVIFAAICEELVAQDVGKGLNNGGQTQNYVTGCGNWNYGSMQFTGWDTKVWSTPIPENVLTDYAANFTTNDAWNKQGHEGAVKRFYKALVTRFKQQGGTFPITSFWDYWATPGNGGVQRQDLPTNVTMRPRFCAEARPTNYQDIVWSITEENTLIPGSC